MSDNKDQIIVQITYDTNDAQKNVNALTEDIIKLEDANKDLKAQLNEGKISQADYSKAVAANSAAIAQNKAERKDNIKFLQAEKGSQDELQKSIKLLTNERKKLDLTTEAGRKKAEELNKKIDELRETTDEYNSALEKNKNNIGNYKSALDALPNGFGAVIQGIWGTVKASWALVATPLGAVLAAVVAVVGLLYSVFKKFEPVIEWFEQKIAAVTAVFAVFKDVVLSVVTGQASLSEAFKGSGAAMAEAAKRAQELKKAEQELDDSKTKLIESDAKAKRQIDELLLQSKDRTKTEKERIALIDEALKIEEQAYNSKKEIADGEFEIVLGKIANDNRLTEAQIQGIRERGVAALQDLQATKAITDDEIKVFAEASAEREQILNESIVIREKAINRQNALADKFAADAAKKDADAKKAAEDAAKEKEKTDLAAWETEKKLLEEKAQRQNDDNAFRIEQENAVIEEQTKARKERIKNKEDEKAKLKEINDKALAEEKDRQQKRADLIVGTYQMIMNITDAFITGQIGSFKDYFKELSIALIRQLKAIIIAKEAEILAQSLAGPLSIATFGAAGVAKAAGIIAITTAAGSLAEAGDSIAGFRR